MSGSRRPYGSVIFGAVAAGLAIVGFVVYLIAISRAATTRADVGGERYSYQRVNGYRGANGPPGLTVSNDLAQKARNWAMHMAGTGVLCHSDDSGHDTAHVPGCGGGRTIHDGIQGNFSIIGENVAVSDNPAHAAQQFEDSPPHRANLLDRRFVQMGIGVVDDTQGRVWVAQVFGAPSGAQPCCIPPPNVLEPQYPGYVLPPIVGSLVWPGGGSMLLTRDGAVYTFDGAPYLGGANKGYFAGHEAATITFRRAGENPSYGEGIDITDTQGNVYRYDGRPGE